MITTTRDHSKLQCLIAKLERARKMASSSAMQGVWFEPVCTRAIFSYQARKSPRGLLMYDPCDCADAELLNWRVLK